MLTPDSERVEGAVVFGGPDWLARPLVGHLVASGLSVTYVGKPEWSIDDARVIPCDPRSVAELERAFASVADLGASQAVHIQTPTDQAAFLSISPSEWNDSANANLTSAFLMCHYLLPAMLDRCFGRIAFVSSLVARTGAPLRTRDAAIQAGVLGLCRAVALEAAHANVTANVVSVVDLDPNQLGVGAPMGRSVEPDDVIDACAFVLADHSSFLTGQEIRVSGGRSLW